MHISALTFSATYVLAYPHRHKLFPPPLGYDIFVKTQNIFHYENVTQNLFVK